MPASQADIAYNYEMWIGRTVDPDPIAWTQILGIESLPFPEQAPEEIDVTHMQSDNRTRETIPGLLGAVDMSLEKQLWLGHEGDALLETLANLTATGAREDVMIEFNSGGDLATPPDMRRTFRGYVNSFTPSGTVGDKAMVTVGFKIFELQATNDRVLT